MIGDPFEVFALPPWIDSALCASVGEPADWFPDQLADWQPGGKAHQAIEVCNRCPVRGACLSWALSLEVAQDDGRPLSKSERYGIFGGLSSSQRAKHARSADAA